MRLVHLLLVAVVATTPLAVAQTPPDTAAIAEANRLGHLFRAYDQAAWHASDAAMALAQADEARFVSTVRGYAVEPDGEGWRVSFGRLSEDASEALVAYEVRLDGAFSPVEVESYPEPVSRSGFVREALRAQASVQFVPPMPPPPPPFRYNSATLPAPDGLLYVYFLPAQAEFNEFYVGADARYTYDPARGAVTSMAVLHPGLSLYDTRATDGPTFSQLPAGHVPTETDVFYALSRRAASGGHASHYVVTPEWTFFLDETGIASWIQTEAFQRRMRLTVDGKSLAP